MKTIKGIDDKLEKFNPTDSDLQAFKDYFRAAVSLSISKAGDEAIEIFELGLKIKRATGDLQLEDAEFKRLKEKVDSNPIGWPNWVHAQLVSKLKDSEK
jgi:hypothetical protein